MKTINYSYARNNLSATMDEVENGSKPIIISRRGKKPMVLMTYDDFKSYDETDYLLASPANAKHLEESIRQMDNGEIITQNINELL